MKHVLGIVTLVLSMGSLPGISLAASDDDRAALTTYLSTALTEDNGFRDRFDAEVWLVDMQQRLAPLVPGCAGTSRSADASSSAGEPSQSSPRVSPGSDRDRKPL